MLYKIDSVVKELPIILAGLLDPNTLKSLCWCVSMWFDMITWE